MLGQTQRLRRDDQLWVGLALLAVATLARLQTFTNPVIGFDEQFYLLVGDRMWHGALPYVDIFDRKPIGLFLIYAGASRLGADSFLAYKGVALLFVTGTAYLIYRASRPMSSPFAAFMSATLYILWLNFMEGEGGQAEVFFTLPMLAAAVLVWQAAATNTRILLRGATAMLLVGLALQIKYTAIFEGIFFGVSLLFAQFQTRPSATALARSGVVWISCALLPTGLAALIYWRSGALDTFMFANFFSMSGKKIAPIWSGLAEIIASLAPLLVLAWPTIRNRQPDILFLKQWALVAGAAVIGFGAYGSPHYGIPIIAPLCLLVAPRLASQQKRIGHATIGVALLAFALGQIVLARMEYLKGGATAATAIAQAATPHRGCIYVYDGYPALYQLTHSCLPTRWAFPGHLNTQDEASPRALGVDPVVEVRRILSTKPDIIIDDDPVFEGGNRATHALVQAAEARDYILVLRYRTGFNRYRLVYRRR